MPIYHTGKARLFRQKLTIFVLCFLLSALSGCGKKGPLYLPDDPKPTAPANDTHSSTTQDTP
ncbi:hypothetical protein CYQ88_04305 [Hydrogenovibrio sp. SC-1]|uniref:LPS translocon maturation chaperone LptM n=1 Tax=Hydrogenovibrio sp. SC-1 TaxID=2065820 RepID=UPI000C7C1520|nr:hypothetical protein CYQ88_04305 [Hydrogenovibrio sp. SC-1]